MHISVPSLSPTISLNIFITALMTTHSHIVCLSTLQVIINPSLFFIDLSLSLFFFHLESSDQFFTALTGLLAAHSIHLNTTATHVETGETLFSFCLIIKKEVPVSFLAYIKTWYRFILLLWSAVVSVRRSATGILCSWVTPSSQWNNAAGGGETDILTGFFSSYQPLPLLFPIESPLFFFYLHLPFLFFLISQTRPHFWLWSFTPPFRILWTLSLHYLLSLLSRPSSMTSTCRNTQRTLRR